MYVQIVDPVGRCPTRKEWNAIQDFKVRRQVFKLVSPAMVITVQTAIMILIDLGLEMYIVEQNWNRFE